MSASATTDTPERENPPAVGAERERIGEGRGHRGEVYRIDLRLDGAVAVDLCCFLVQNHTTEDFAAHHRRLLRTRVAALSESSVVVLDVDRVVGELACAIAPSVVAASSPFAEEPPDCDHTRLAGEMATRILSAARTPGVHETLGAG